jgi:putative addiction module component (TIGR02574 family)
MSDIPLNDILKLPLKERLDLVERIWDSIAADQGALPLGGSAEAPSRAVLTNAHSLPTRGLC